MTGRTRRGQALMELAVGMFTLAFLVSALVVFAQYIVRSLEIENHLRGSPAGDKPGCVVHGGGDGCA